MNDLVTCNSSNDLSEASSVASFDSQETDFTDRTDLVSNVTKRVHDSPTDIRSFPDYNEITPNPDDPLPIVDEGKVLTEQSLADGPVNAYSRYDDEEQDFTREMNTTKIAFSAYRNAVLHLVHHQPSSKNKGEENGNSGSSSPGTTSSEDNANQRMKALEEVARNIVETKAKACIEAVEVANDFVSRRHAKEAVRLGRSAYFQELLGPNKKITNSAPQQNPRNQSKTATVDLPDKAVNAPPQEAEKENIAKANAVIKPKPKLKSTKKVPSKGNSSNDQRLPYVKRKKITRHPDCILHTLPKFKYIPPESKEDKNDKNDDEETPACYGTSSWIGNMVKWRIQRKQFKMSSFEKCGCPDCRNDLKKL